MPPIEIDFDRNAVVTIQGGGVFGLSLLGQLQAVIDAGIQPVALAGTSAGAIVATFYWAGLQPEAIRDHFATLSEHPNGLIDLIGPFDRPGQTFGYAAFLQWSQRLSKYLNFLRRGSSAGRHSAFWRILIGGLMAVPVALSLPAYAARAFLIGRDLWAFNGLVRSRGLFAGEHLEREIDRILRTSPQLQGYAELLPAPPDQPNGRLLTFGDFAAVGEERGELFSPLFLTATNLRARNLELFDSIHPTYAHVPVARAVRASAGFPFFFQPVDIEYPDRDESYVDGGVVCNFPAFVFAETFRQRLLDHPFYKAWAMRPWVHIGLRLSDAKRPFRAKELQDPGAFLNALVALGTGAARTDLEGRAAAMISRSITVAQPFSDTNGPEGVLAVEKIDRRTIGTMFERGRTFATGTLAARTFQLPDTEEVEPLLAELIEQAGLVFGDTDNSRCEFRVNVFIPEQAQLVLRYRANMDDPVTNPDREMEFPFDCGLTGYCFTRRRPVLCNLEQFAAWFKGHPENGLEDLFGFTPEMQAVVRRDRTWLLSMPIMDPYATAPCVIAANPDVATTSLHYTELDSPHDGAIFGVLNLDARIDYVKEGLAEEPADQVGAAKIRAILGIMRSLALSLGVIFSNRFAPERP
ncbi:patatin-like phospholipase family protein [Gemmata sp. JC717]|uniref:patatin-like phospholipase family protein n=1 Tax=Gemmata algarum TaxID=2975278 RepID=UPI0021BB6A29|nr:patatin-like phospholipase family protein [Gemmata algarum]MDY3555754.1 patatin-like phospholipase family protein [Gemmata algarum]